MTRSDVIAQLSSAGLRVGPGFLLLDNDYEPVSLDAVREIASALLDALPPELVAVQDRGGIRHRVPRWTPEAGDCETHSIALWVWAMIGNWLRAVRSKEKRGGLAFGFVAYVAEPRAENRYRAGGHAICWFIDHARQLRFYEFGDNSETDLTPTERASVFGGGAA